MAAYVSLLCNGIASQVYHLLQANPPGMKRGNDCRDQIRERAICKQPPFSQSSMCRLRWVYPGAALLFSCLLTGPANSRETIFTCITNNDGTSTCVSNNSDRSLNCARSGSGIRTCLDPRTNERLNCVINADGTVSCVDPDTSEKLDCVGLGMGENACKNGNNKSKPADIIEDPGLFNKPPTELNETEIQSLPEVIELPSAF